jgi:tetratricopeptide (TPR) repeat protein
MQFERTPTMRAPFGCLALALVVAACAAETEQDQAAQDTIPEVAQLKAAAAADTTNWQAQVRLSEALRHNQRLAEASEAAQKAFMLAPTPGTEARLEMAKVFAASDRSMAAINLVKEVERKKRDQSAAADEVKIAEVYAVLGDASAVFRWLDRAIEANSPNLGTVKTNPDFKSVHDDPRWQDMVAKLP